MLPHIPRRGHALDAARALRVPAATLPATQVASGRIIGSALRIAIACRDGVFEPLEEGPDAAAYPHHS